MAQDVPKLAPTSAVEDSTHYKEVSGTELPGTKYGMDVSLPLHDPYINLVTLALVGNQPEPVYDEIVRTSISTTQIDYVFNLSSTRQFYVSVTNIDTSFPTALVVTNSTLVQESGDALLLETGTDDLLKETA